MSKICLYYVTSLFQLKYQCKLVSPNIPPEKK
nr:MAG TPA: hypothetical protein [Caudoviricetes sp.]